MTEFCTHAAVTGKCVSSDTKTSSCYSKSDMASLYLCTETFGYNIVTYNSCEPVYNTSY